MTIIYIGGFDSFERNEVIDFTEIVTLEAKIQKKLTAFDMHL